MQQGEDEQSGLPPPPLSYRLVRRFYRFLTNVWFREITVVDQENIPEEGGVLYITWHPSGLIDPMLMTPIERLQDVDDSKDWALLVEEQRRLSAELVALGSGLVLPGDPDWKDPPAGHHDAASVRFRQSQTVS